MRVALGMDCLACAFYSHDRDPPGDRAHQEGRGGGCCKPYSTQAWTAATSPPASCRQSACDRASFVAEPLSAPLPSSARSVASASPDPSESAWKTMPVRSSDSVLTDHARSP